jgi:hypothetical protein
MGDLLHKFAKALRNSLLWSVNTSAGSPKHANTQSKKAAAANFAEFWGRATNLIHLLKCSTITNTYISPCGVITNGLAKFNDQQ